MNKKYFKFSAFILAGALLASCGKDDNEEIKPSNEPEFPTEYSELSVEQNKQKLEDNGIDLVNGVTDLKNTGGIQASIAFSKHADGADGLDNVGGRKGSKQGTGLANLLASFGEGKMSASKTLSALRMSEDDFTSIQDEFNSATGTYVYSKANDEWTYTAGGDKIVFKFPSTEAGTANNAEYSVFGYKGVKIESNLGGSDYTGDYPTALQAELKVDGTKKMGYALTAAYDSKGEPTAASVTIDIDNFKFAYSVSSTTAEAKMDYALTQDGKNLISLGARSTGDFNSSNVENSNGPEDVFNKGTAYFQIMNIKFSGDVDSDKLAAALESADTDAEVAAAWNANYQLIVFYADSKKKIADSEFYVTTKTSEYTVCEQIFDEEGNWIDSECSVETETYETLDVRLVFADESKATLETYTDAGFDELSQKLEEFYDSFE